MQFFHFKFFLSRFYHSLVLWIQSFFFYFLYLFTVFWCFRRLFVFFFSSNQLIVAVAGKLLAFSVIESHSISLFCMLFFSLDIYNNVYLASIEIVLKFYLVRNFYSLQMHCTTRIQAKKNNIFKRMYSVNEK